MFERRGQQWFVEDVCAAEIAQRVGTPAYVYSSAHFSSRYRALVSALAGVNHRIFYSVKANSNLSVLRLFRELGAGFDIVSAGELERALAAGATPGDIVFSGVGKRVDEIDYALKLGIHCFNVESADELARLSERARLLGRRARMALRINPDIDARTHPYISTGLKENKFGVPIQAAAALYARAHADEHLDVEGIDCHIGSQIAEVTPLIQALDAMLALRRELQDAGIPVRHLDLGGGLGIAYQNEADFDVTAYGNALRDRLRGEGVAVAMEPGRFLVGNGGALLTRVEYLKPALLADAPSFAIVDAAMTELIRPALYSAWHDVLALEPCDAQPASWDIVGPVCESGDFLARGRRLALRQGTLLAVLSAGAYGFVQSSNYNSRPRPPEVLVEGDTFRVIRRRETLQDLLAPERECL
ncbi:MAG: diaminopimelate decarboxylase [Pseudomonadales bacterium]